LFQKDAYTIVDAAPTVDYAPEILKTALSVNNQQSEHSLSLGDNYIDVIGKRVAVLGLALKPGTDDICNSRAVSMREKL
jgi:UDPglucose 6-dehydrogenase